MRKNYFCNKIITSILMIFVFLFSMFPVVANAESNTLDLRIYSALNEFSDYDYDHPIGHTTITINDTFGGTYYTDNTQGHVYMDDIAPNTGEFRQFNYSSGYTHGTYYQISFCKDIPADLPEDISISGSITLPLPEGYDYSSAKMYQRDYSQMIPRYLPVDSVVSGRFITLNYTKKVWDSFELMVEMKPVAPKSSLSLSKTNVTLYTGNKSHSATVKATVKGASQKVTWTSKNKNIATVSSTGVITGVNPGTTTISAKANGITKKVTVVVKNPVITVKSGTKKVSSVTVKKGKSITLNVSASPTGSTITLVKGKENIAKATFKNGKLKLNGVKKGIVTISLKCGKAVKQIKVTVK